MNSHSPLKPIERAIEFCHQGGLIGLPTETVYGLAAPIDSEEQLKKIFEIKERPLFDPLIVHIYDKYQALDLCLDWTPLCDTLAEIFWPGPLTLVLKRNPKKISSLITAGLETVGVRCPSHPVAQEFLRKLGKPVAAPSANKFTKTSPTKAQDVSDAFSPEDVFVLDGGECEVGVESTIVLVEETRLTILRKGMITANEILEQMTKKKITVEVVFDTTPMEKKMTAPGQMAAHYRPVHPVVIVMKKDFQKYSQEILRSFDLLGIETLALRTLSNQAYLAARELYETLKRPLKSQEKVLVLCLPEFEQNQKEKEKWEAILDRLKKAAVLNFLP